ncbi:MAG: pyridoxal phosphate-dependent decarboxylase family protein, partial [Terriglobales bacterium]
MALSVATPTVCGSLDPADWEAFRARAHRLLEQVLDHLQTAASGPVWRPVPPAVRAATQRPLPRQPTDGDVIARDLAELVLPHGVGNTHPRFFGWVHGAGTPGGVLAELVTAAVNANCGGREHAAVYFERQVLQWAREIFSFPESSSGLLVSGTSMANLVAVQAARTAALPEARDRGLIAAGGKGLVGYASSAVHSCIEKAFGISGLGRDALRRLPVNDRQHLDPVHLDNAIQQDKDAGLDPFLVIATAGTADTGAMEDLDALGAIARRHRLWFHVDGAFGALAILSPAHRHLVAGIERADSLAFDFHKWAHVPYDAGCVLIRDEAVHRRAFA